MNLPWRFDRAKGLIVDAKDKVVVFCAAGRMQNDKENAFDDFQLIVDAVNERAELRAEIEKLKGK